MPAGGWNARELFMGFCVSLNRHPGSPVRFSIYISRMSPFFFSVNSLLFNFAM
jgi:hypothetical protein